MTDTNDDQKIRVDPTTKKRIRMLGAMHGVSQKRVVEAIIEYWADTNMSTTIDKEKKL